MNNFGTLYKYEVKKIVCKKLFVVMCVLLLVLIALTPFSGLFGTHYENGEPIGSCLDIYKIEQSRKMALSGRTIDYELLKETVEAYGQVPDELRYTSTPEYREYAIGYNEIFSFIRMSTGMDFKAIKAWEPDEEELYKSRKETLNRYFEECFITDAELKFWKEKNDKINGPFTYTYHDAYEILIDSFQTVSVIVMAFIAIVLSGLFPNEKVLKTDQLILSNVLGRKSTFAAKLLAGITVSLGCSLILSAILFAECLGYYGTQGFEFPFIMVFSASAIDISVGQVCVIAYLVLQTAVLLWAIIVMVMSEFLKNGIATLAISMVFIIAGGMISFPVSMRVAGQIWDWLPTNYPAIWNMFDERTLPIAGKCLISWKVVPIIYLLVGTALFFMGKRKYERVSAE
ncbi:MAG: ABC transporter permease subunit [Lachnospiraceae bacterium]|nr:ABC transporter permease subunit [Lachnospiraceae bacterium]